MDNTFIELCEYSLGVVIGLIALWLLMGYLKGVRK